jgi:hypothetical protein
MSVVYRSPRRTVAHALQYPGLKRGHKCPCVAWAMSVKAGTRAWGTSHRLDRRTAIHQQFDTLHDSRYRTDRSRLMTPEGTRNTRILCR